MAQRVRPTQYFRPRGAFAGHEDGVGFLYNVSGLGLDMACDAFRVSRRVT